MMLARWRSYWHKRRLRRALRAAHASPLPTDIRLFAPERLIDVPPDADANATDHTFGWLAAFETLAPDQLEASLKPAIDNWMQTYFRPVDVEGVWHPHTSAQRAIHLCTALPVLQMVLPDGDLHRLLHVHRAYCNAHGASPLANGYLDLVFDHAVTPATAQALHDALDQNLPAKPSAYVTQCAQIVALQPDISPHDIVTNLTALTLGDGGVATFNGGVAHPLADPLAVLRACDHQPALGYKSHYAHLRGGRTRVVMDTAHHVAHPSALAFEMSVGRRRLVTSCASHPTLSPQWQQALQHRNAHSTLIMDTHDNTVSRATVLRQNNPSLLHADHHDAIVARCALGKGQIQHERCLSLSRDGSALAGIDTVQAVRLHNQDIDTDQSFVIRFHLHSDVKATLNTRGTTVTLTLPTQERWYMQQTGARTLSLEDSIYCASDATIQQTCQIVLTGKVCHTDADPVTLEWMFRKLDARKRNIRDTE